MFTWIDDRQYATEVWNDLVLLLREQGIKFVSKVTDKTFIFEFDNKWFTIHDNGGEINVELINDESTLRSVPYTSNKYSMTTGTLVYRLLRAMKNESIDYEFFANFGKNII